MQYISAKQTVSFVFEGIILKTYFSLLIQDCTYQIMVLKTIAHFCMHSSKYITVAVKELLTNPEFSTRLLMMVYGFVKLIHKIW